MPVQWERLLAALGCQVLKPISELQVCPAHPNAPASLQVSIVDGVPRFGCSTCRFDGDAVELVARVRKLSLTDALNLFNTDPQLRDSLVHNYSDVHHKAYMEARNSQVLLLDYVTRCQKALTTDAGRAILATLRNNAQLHTDIPPGLGLFLPEIEHLPPICNQPRLTKPALVVFVHYCNGQVSALGVRNLEKDLYDLIPLTGGITGVYPDLTITGSTLILTKDERIATGVYSLAKGRGLASPMISAACLPLPFKYRHIARIYLWNSPVTRYNISEVLGYMTHLEPIQGCKTQVEFFMLTRDRDFSENLSRPSEHHCQPAMAWVAAELLQIYWQRGLAAVVQLLQTSAGVEKVQDKLLGALRAANAPADLLNQLDTAANALQDRITLTNGSIVLRTPTGFKGTRPADQGAFVDLSNFTFRTNSVVQNAEGVLYYNCTLSVGEHAPIEAVFTDFTFENAKDLRSAVTSAYGRHGILVNPVANCVRGFNWMEIRNLFSRHIPVQQELPHLGVSSEGSLELPRISIPADGATIKPQTRILRNNPLDAIYGAIRPTGETDLQCYVDLWNDRSLGAGALTCCLSHLVYNTLLRLTYAYSENKHQVHCLLLDNENQKWETTLGQFTRIISGKDQPIRWVPSHEREEEWLGTLTLPVAAYGRLKIDSLERLLDLSNPVLALLPCTAQQTLAKTAKIKHASFLRFDSQAALVAALPHAQMLALQRALPELLRRVVAEHHTNGALHVFDRRQEPQLPSVAGGHLFVQELLGTEPMTPEVAALLRKGLRE